jgi:hypothetical protein
MNGLTFTSVNPPREVRYVPRTAEQDPHAWVVVPHPHAHDNFLADIQSPGNGIASMVKTVTANGLAADVAADMWARYGKLREAVAENPRARWQQWASGKLATHKALGLPETGQVLLLALAEEEKALQAAKQPLHPVAAAMRDFIYGQVQLASLNGSTPAPELLPPPTMVNPVEVVGMVALELAQQQE